MAMVLAENVSRRFGSGDEGLLALDRVTFAVGIGEFVSIVGPSGCGKSTLLRIIAGLRAPTSGHVVLDNTTVQGPTEGIGMAFQSPALMPWRTVLRNVELPVEVKGLRLAAYRQQALQLIELVGLKGFEHHYPFELSGGMQQRVALCRALICDPPVILMDEPFGALDALTREQMNLELQRIWLERKKTVVFVTHSIPEAIFLSDRVLVMTPRPGMIRSIVPIQFSRPRTLEVFQDAEFWRLAERIRGDLTHGAESTR
jgi:NitT/TauT family transport system ATP-binding protein